MMPYFLVEVEEWRLKGILEVVDLENHSQLHNKDLRTPDGDSCNPSRRMDPGVAGIVVDDDHIADLPLLHRMRPSRNPNYRH